MDELLKEFEHSGEAEIGDKPLELLTTARRANWEKATEKINFQN